MENRDDQKKNQTGQQGQSGSGQTGSDKAAPGDAGGDTTLAHGQKSQLDAEKDKQRPGETGSDKGFVGSSKEEDSSDAYLSQSETGQSDFAEQGQGATERNEDIESGASPKRDASLDDGS